MTHLEIFRAADAVVENLGLKGSVCVAADLWSYRPGDRPTRRRVDYRISFVPENEFADCLQEGGESPESALVCWTERMRVEYGPKSKPTEAELAEVLDAHQAESAA